MDNQVLAKFWKVETPAYNHTNVKSADPEKSFVVCTDASKEGVGGEPTQKGKVIAYESWKLKDNE